jgi:nicotinate phosphoribosyltransferase
VDAGVKVARASYIAGFLGTSNLLAGKIYGIPIFGTMAHSYVTSFKTEMDSFRAFSRAFPDNVILLIDTYDTLCGARKAVEVGQSMAVEGKRLLGVRLDSGDLVQLSCQVRAILDDAGLPDVRIMASGSLDEFRLKELLDAGADIDTFAVGTRMGVSADAPYLDIVYKLVEYDGQPVLKLSSGKKTWVGKKQIFRYYDDQGRMREDLLALVEENHPDGEPLIEVVIDKGRLSHPSEPLGLIRDRFSEEWKRLPAPYKDMDSKTKYPVRTSPGLHQLEERTAIEKTKKEIWQCSGRHNEELKT